MRAFVLLVLLTPLIVSAQMDMGRANAICNQDRSRYDPATCGRQGQPPCWTGHYCQQSDQGRVQAYGYCYWKQDENRGLCRATWPSADGLPTLPPTSQLPSPPPVGGGVGAAADLPHTASPGIMQAFDNSATPPAEASSPSVPDFGGDGFRGYLSNSWERLQELAGWSDTTQQFADPPAMSPPDNYPPLQLPRLDPPDIGPSGVFSGTDPNPAFEPRVSIYGTPTNFGSNTFEHTAAPPNTSSSDTGGFLGRVSYAMGIVNESSQAYARSIAPDSLIYYQAQQFLRENWPR